MAYRKLTQEVIDTIVSELLTQSMSRVMYSVL